ncbi:MAG: PilZ domain-containing protein [Deltaproteobacteria bacterium]|nr:PilZ domain-containing protein [Deltaproteobacteria bacterium]
MKEPVWERCHYYCSGQCPEQSTMDKAYLIPQLLKPSQLKAAADTCDKCGYYHEEKRKYRRVTRSFKVLVSNKEPRKNTQGTIVDVSINGALIKLDNWINVNKNETVNLQLYADDIVKNEEKTNVINVCGRIKRATKEKRELAIMFVKDTSVKKCANI